MFCELYKVLYMVLNVHASTCGMGYMILLNGMSLHNSTCGMFLYGL